MPKIDIQLIRSSASSVQRELLDSKIDILPFNVVSFDNFALYGNTINLFQPTVTSNPDVLTLINETTVNELPFAGAPNPDVLTLINETTVNELPFIVTSVT